MPVFVKLQHFLKLHAELHEQKLLGASTDTCGFVQFTLVRKRQQAVGGVLEAFLHPHLTHRNSIFQLTASNPSPTLCHI